MKRCQIQHIYTPLLLPQTILNCLNDVVPAIEEALHRLSVILSGLAGIPAVKKVKNKAPVFASSFVTESASRDFQVDR